MRRSEETLGPLGSKKRLFVSILQTPARRGMHRMKAFGFRESLDTKGLTAKYRGAVEAVSVLNLPPHARFEAFLVECQK
ncbi:hypothetical protein [Paraburkholderia sp. HP33-1]|uniref:hypothetical protein n=1 Tax=Paraburkholderia sp. HP33-1 TaxID=2883243 RepID=UPI001F21E849|nr:hypothetical protein [Paraburkholderia sp. HP33-1]